MSNDMTSRKTVSCRYYLTVEGGEEQEVTLVDYLLAERQAGFTARPGQAATCAFSANGITGCQKWSWEETKQNG